MGKYLDETKLLNYSNIKIQELIKERKWLNLNDVNKVKAIYNFVRDEILFGYNSKDDIMASQVLEDGYGQCNTKATLLMALLRACGIANRLHGFTIRKSLQEGAISGVWYFLSPKYILHTWVEVLVNNKWYILEGVIIDRKYLKKVQENNESFTGDFCGFGIYTDDFSNPPIEWNLNNTYIQNNGINKDFGLFDNPDVFYKKHQQAIGVFKRFFFKNFVRHIINKNVEAIRKGI